MDSLAGNKGIRMKKLPMRQCTGCGKRKEKKALIRIIRTPDDEIQVDFTGKKNGRGAYICNSVDCLRLAQKRNALSRSLKTEIPVEVYEELAKEMDNREDGSCSSDGGDRHEGRPG